MNVVLPTIAYHKVTVRKDSSDHKLYLCPVKTKVHESFMHRCIALAQLGAGHVAPNPMVGAVLVHDNKIIGEGFHEMYGGPHAEVNCLSSVEVANRHLIEQSTLYVSLEPCAHHGQTPPCTDLIIHHNIPHVVMGTQDPFESVNGQGIQQLENAGIQVTKNILEEECRELNKRFFTFHQKKRPYIILKWAESVNHKMTDFSQERTFISHALTNRWVHRWRSEEAAIMVGTTTALKDNPQLTNRYFPGKQPLRIVIDRNLQLPKNLHVFNDYPTLIFNSIQESKEGTISFKKLSPDQFTITNMLNMLFELKIQSVLIEGGPTLLQSFLQASAWDEIRIITNPQLCIPEGLSSPIVENAAIISQSTHTGDQVNFFKNMAHNF